MGPESYISKITTPKENKSENNSRVYNLESGIQADLTFKEFQPKIKSVEQKESGLEEWPNNAVIFLPGISMNPDDKMLQNLGQEYSTSAQEKTYIIKTDLKKTEALSENYKTLDLFYEEAIAVSKFIKEKKLKEITLVGYSLGGPKVIDLAHIMQNDKDLKINGLILLNSLGLYEQTGRDLKTNLIKDSLTTPIKVVKDMKERNQYPDAFKRGAQSAMNVISNLVSDQVGSGFRKVIKTDSSEMGHINQRVSEIKVPVILISGTEDKVIQIDKIIPPEITSYDEQENYLKENLFKQSPFVRIVTAKKFGKHGLPVFRAEEVANVSVHLLKRFNKPDTYLD
jgi:esterase/lipase